MAASQEPARPTLRRDAERNRQRIIAAAHEVFRERGLTATLDDVARHAGVGVGTVYRRFANKEELVDALFADMVDQVESISIEAAADPDAWRGLATSLERLCELQAFDRGLREVMLGTGRGPQRKTQMYGRIRSTVDQLVDRAKAQGALRPDMQPWDLPMVQLMVAAVTDNTGHPDLWRRYLRLLLDGLRARPDVEPLPDIRLGGPGLIESIGATTMREMRERPTE